MLNPDPIETAERRPASARTYGPAAPPALRVAYLINQYPKVSHSFIRREIQALEHAGVTVERLALRGWDAAVVDDEDRLEQERTRYLLQGGAAALLGALLGCAAASPGRFFRAVKLACRLGRRADRPLPLHFIYLAEACLAMQWLRERAVDHVHAHFGTNATEVALLMQALGGPSYSFTVHGPEEFDRPEALKLREKVSHAAFVVAISSYGRSQLYRWSDTASWPKVQQVHCGLESSFHGDAGRGVPDAPRLVCVGRLCEQKGQLLLLEAAHRVVQAGVALQLVLAGDGEMRPQVEAAIARLGLRSHVRITGWVSSDQVRDEILAARALVLPSFAEGLPVVLMEAMALRRPVLTTFVAGIPELVREGQHGWLFPAGDVDALAQAMLQCLNAPVDALSRMGERGRERVLMRHSIDTEARKLEALFRRYAEPNR